MRLLDGFLAFGEDIENQKMAAFPRPKFHSPQPRALFLAENTSG
ncbi:MULTISPECIES: hypothetical protein [unclassified Aliiroseovarius]|nr:MULTISPECIES: hypothetical protein [unclassified Aliiroseovarius]